MVIFVSRVVTYGDFIDLVIFSISNQSEKLMEKLDDLNCNLAPILKIFLFKKFMNFQSQNYSTMNLTIFLVINYLLAR